MKIGIIAAVSSDNVIGVGKELPWWYPGDIRYFKERTMNCTVIMGRRTWESIGEKSLPNRNNIIISRELGLGGPYIEPTKTEYSLIYAHSIQSAVEMTEMFEDDIWFIGGYEIFKEGMKYANTMEITNVNEKILMHDNKHKDLVFFPDIDYEEWKIIKIKEHPYDSSLTLQILKRRNLGLGF